MLKAWFAFVSRSNNGFRLSWSIVACNKVFGVLFVVIELGTGASAGQRRNSNESALDLHHAIRGHFAIRLRSFIDTKKQ